jgi:hypothetical protein
MGVNMITTKDFNNILKAASKRAIEQQSTFYLVCDSVDGIFITNAYDGQYDKQDIAAIANPDGTIDILCKFNNE